MSIALSNPEEIRVDRKGSGLGQWHVQHATRRNEGKQMSVAARYKLLIDAALAYGDAWRARKAFRKQFRQEPRVDQVFLKATAAQLDKNVADSRRNLEKMAIRLGNDPSEQIKIKQENQIREGETRC
jgi:uncharacterized protein YneF (UPF0154 family)